MGRIEKSDRDAAAQAALEADTARTVAVAETDLRVARGQLFPVELEVALAQGTIGAEEHTDFLAALKRFKDERARRIEGMERIDDLLARRQKPDGADPADRTAVDAVFENLAEDIAEQPPEDRAWIEDNFVRRTGMLPAALRDRLLGGMFSDDTAIQVAAAERIVRLWDIEPTVGDDIPDYMLARARTIKAFAYPGLTPDRTVQLADIPSCSQILRESNGLNRRNHKLGAGQDRRRHHHIVDR